MPPKPTSVLAYRKLIESGQARTQRDKIFAFIMKHSDDGMDVCRDQIERGTGVRINAVCGRVKELLDMDMIRVSRKAKSPYTPEEVEYLELMPIVIKGNQITLFP